MYWIKGNNPSKPGVYILNVESNLIFSKNRISRWDSYEDEWLDYHGPKSGITHYAKIIPPEE